MSDGTNKKKVLDSFRKIWKEQGMSDVDIDRIVGPLKKKLGVDQPQEKEEIWGSGGGRRMKVESDDPRFEGVVTELLASTTDESASAVLGRAVGLYRTIVRHVKAGGTVRFVDADGTERTLKVRLRPAK